MGNGRTHEARSLLCTPFMRLRRLLGFSAPSVLAAALGVGTWLAPGVARADRVYVIEERDDYYAPRSSLNLGFDLEGAVPIDVPRSLSGNDVHGGGGFKVRVGDQIRWPRLRITPEGGYAYDHLFASDDVGNSYAWDVHRLFGGVRFAFGHFVTPGFYAHLGYGWRDTADPTVARSHGLAFDAGGFLDFHVVPHFGFGIHVEYVNVDAQPYTPHWIALGGHVDVNF
jgi:hypothetical protein